MQVRLDIAEQARHHCDEIAAPQERRDHSEVRDGHSRAPLSSNQRQLIIEWRTCRTQARYDHMRIGEPAIEIEGLSGGVTVSHGYAVAVADQFGPAIAAADPREDRDADVDLSSGERVSRIRFISIPCGRRSRRVEHPGKTTFDVSIKVGLEPSPNREP